MTELQEDILEDGPGIRRASFPQVGGGYELTSSWPLAQAVGDFDGIAFSFHAKYGDWEFYTEDQHGHLFPAGHPNFFLRRGKYDQKGANAMTIGWALRILRKCFVEYWDRPA